MNVKQHKAVYSVPDGDEFVRVEVIAPLGMPVAEIKESVQTYLRLHPGAVLLSRTWNENDL
jgi:hypothetical protein